ncbi:Hypothetical protein LUCI_1850 [Lucifera butyrica]|uniref:Putative Flp pilus-assembly TadG-like N-terminal domain-containing protein n=1 Tax=Lucifera butyrica TaxID=1351585 RepID=A0A498R583_9FIRM|nr:pilus assembly protein TadG-related protein [Lucifera butyrica]VBB06614.1 Hypothetical protein LUCI_1850 [Lucifera butyrica]
MPDRRKNQQGMIAVLTALVLTALLGVAALVVDVGVLYINKVQLANLADAAALAGAQDLPDNPQQAVASASSYAATNGQNNDSVNVSVSNNNTVLSVQATRAVDLYFARIFAISRSDVQARATARISPLSSFSGVVPFGVVQQEFQYGAVYSLKLGAGTGYNGNFAALALGGTGAANYLNNIEYGYQGRLQVVDWVPLEVETETGNMSGPTMQGVDYRVGLDPAATWQTVQKGSPRIVVVPVINSLDGDGQHDVQIVGFAAFFLEGCGGAGIDNYVTGEFLHLVEPGDVSDNVGEYGAYGVSLIQ